MMVDLSHRLSDRTFWQVLEYRAEPRLRLAFLRAGAICPDQMRNLTDEMLTALGARGGYVGVNFFATIFSWAAGCRRSTGPRWTT